MDGEMNAPISSVTQGFSKPLCKYTVPWPTPAASWTAGETVNIQFNSHAVSHSGGHAEFSISYDGGKTFVVIHQVLRYVFVGKKPAAITNEVSVYDYNIKLPEKLPSSDKAVFAWTWVNASGNREFYMNCADVTIKGTSESIIGKEVTIVNYPDYPTVPEFNMDYETGINYYTTNAKYIKVYGNGKSEAATSADSDITYEGRSINSSNRVSEDSEDSSSNANNEDKDTSSSNARNDEDRSSSNTKSSVSNTDDEGDSLGDKCDNGSDDIDEFEESDYVDESDDPNDKCDDESDDINDSPVNVGESDIDSSSDPSSKLDISDEIDVHDSMESSDMDDEIESKITESSSELDSLSDDVDSILSSSSDFIDDSSAVEIELPEPSSSESDALDSVESSSATESRYAWPIAFSNEPELVCDINSDDSLYYAYGEVYYSGVFASYPYLVSDYMYNHLVLETMESISWATKTVTVHDTSTLGEYLSSELDNLGELDGYSSNEDFSESSSENVLESNYDKYGYPLFEFSSAISSETD
ncbi:hypothetical protein IW138_002915 [Coemansia sp. RSA 986]|nr:hypothetical protein IW138_002915 [Coemansia sp. RSA 986]